jgi:diadenylate cyclase
MTPLELRWLDIVDIALVAFIVYYVLLWLQGTRALTLIRGLLLISIVNVSGRVLGLYAINWLFDRFAAIIALMLIILFQPELRRMLERFGRGKFLGTFGLTHAAQGSFQVRSIVRAVEQMAAENTGALIVIERLTGLNEYLESGVRLVDHFDRAYPLGLQPEVPAARRGDHRPGRAGAGGQVSVADLRIAPAG